jgi:hypothetical protein
MRKVLSLIRSRVDATAEEHVVPETRRGVHDDTRVGSELNRIKRFTPSRRLWAVQF